MVRSVVIGDVGARCVTSAQNGPGTSGDSKQGAPSSGLPNLAGSDNPVEWARQLQPKGWPLQQAFGTGGWGSLGSPPVVRERSSVRLRGRQAPGFAQASMLGEHLDVGADDKA